MMDAVLQTRKFDAALWGLASGDADPNSEMNVWSSDGTLHVWNLKSPNAPRQPLDPWEMEVDRLMAAQMTTMNVTARKAAYDRVQQLVSANLPLVFLASPHVLAAGDRNLGNFEPSVMRSSSAVERGSTVLGDAAAMKLVSRASRCCLRSGDGHQVVSGTGACHQPVER